MSLYRGIVTDTNDPEGLMRIKARVPQVYGEAESDWMWPSIPVAFGVQAPSVSNPVWVMFEGDDKARPVWVGVWRTSGQGGLSPDFNFGGVVSETTYGLASSNGSAQTVSRSDHTHGSPPNLMPGHEAAGNPHPQYATDVDLADHVSHVNPHPNYSTDADLAAVQASLTATQVTLAQTQAALADQTVLYWMTRVTS